MKIFVLLISGSFFVFIFYQIVWFNVFKILKGFGIDYFVSLNISTRFLFHSDFFVITILSFLILVVGCFLFIIYFSDFFTKEERLVKGGRLVDKSDLIDLIRKNGKDLGAIDFVGIKFPSNIHGHHVLALGPTGKGKTNSIYSLIEGIDKTAERRVIVDPDGSYFSRFAKSKDILLNPMDIRGVKWDPFSDLLSITHSKALAKALIPSQNHRSEEWSAYARPLLSKCIDFCLREGNSSIASLLALLALPAERLKELIDVTFIPGYFSDGANRALGSVLFTISTRLQMFEETGEGNFSIRNWVRKGTGDLYLTWRVDQLDVLSSYYAAILEVCISEMTSYPSMIPTWLIIDELGQLEQIPSLHRAVSYGRGKSLKVLLGLQSISQLDHIYGREESLNIRNNLGTTLLLGGAVHDADATKSLSVAFGEIELLSPQVTQPVSGGAAGSITYVRRKEPVISPSDIVDLPIGTGILKLSGYPVARLKIPKLDVKPRLKPFETNFKSIKGGFNCA